MNEVAVEADRLTKTYSQDGESFNAVDAVSFELPFRGVFGLLGPNGAGKTTTLEMLAGLRPADRGSVRVLGVDPFVDRQTMTRRLSIQPQKAALFQHQTVQELLGMWASFFPHSRAPADVIEELDLSASARTRVAHLSGGQLQRVLVGTAIISRPEILVLDEPSAGLDPNIRDDLWRVIRNEGERGTLVLLSTHSMEEAEELCESVIIMHEGRIVADGTPRDLIIENVPGGDVGFVIDPERFSQSRLRSDILEPELDYSVERLASGLSIFVETSDTDFFLKRLLASEAASSVRHITVGRVGLDHVFRTVTGKELLDD